jgi:hypothetical protein
MAGGQQSIDKDLQAFRALSLWLWHGHEKPWVYSDKKAQAIYEKISPGYGSISLEELEFYLPREEVVESKFPMRKFLYLNPVEGLSLVPVLTIASDFGFAIPKLRMRLMLFLLHDGELKAFGYRFESPEGPGIHHYYHAQPITDFELSSPEIAGWLPTKGPTFPLDANSPVKLLLSLLISLYGTACISQIKQQVPGIDSHLEEMGCQNLPDWKFYRKVITCSGKKEDVYETTDPVKFDREMNAKYPKCHIKGITKGAYERSSKVKRKK